MKTADHICRASVLVVMLGIIAGLPMSAQDGKRRVKVHPTEAYVFVDGRRSDRLTTRSCSVQVTIALMEGRQDLQKSRMSETKQ